ncbi:glycoside hydrolase family 88/105 protein [Enterococcus timonensis]|uniref:glycoside hydrolase family 88/105 protein n=1 Tax=Enterococcus timonensis TaxID=1852364 RepID=UPI0009F700A7|nr:glycoside hydrolase family 88 protein [Enterococcus timonensis]
MPKTKEELENLSLSIIDKTLQMDLTWDWSCGVAYYGICRLYETTGDKNYLTDLKVRVDELIEFGFSGDWTVNKCAMGHCLLTLMEVFGDEKYQELIDSKIDYLQNRALRFGDGVLQHTVSSNNDFPEQVWADTLFMAAFFMLRVGVINNDQALIKDALNQYDWHITYLQNPQTGLFYHGYNNLAHDNLSSIYWGRANAWAAYTMAQVGQRLPQAYLYPEFMNIQGSLNEQLAALKFLQTDNGLWRTVLDDATSYEEISASCGIAAAMKINNNPLHQKFVEKAFVGILGNISETGRVENVSAGTAVMRDELGYREITKKWLQGWGQGLALAFLAEFLK